MCDVPARMGALHAAATKTTRRMLMNTTRRTSACYASSSGHKTRILESKYAKEVLRGWEAVQCACALTRRVQQGIADGELESKEDASPVTVADYGAQAIINWYLSQTDPSGKPLQMVAEEDSGTLRRPENAAMLTRIVDVVNDALQAHPKTRSIMGRPNGCDGLDAASVMANIDLGNSDGGRQGLCWVLDPIGTRI